MKIYVEMQWHEEEQGKLAASGKRGARKRGANRASGPAPLRADVREMGGNNGAARDGCLEGSMRDKETQHVLK